MTTRQEGGIEGTTNYTSRQTIILVAATATQILRANKMRTAYRIYSAPSNQDNTFVGPNGNITTLNSYDVIGPGEVLEDSGWFTCSKGEVWVINDTADTLIVEEVTLSERR